MPPYFMATRTGTIKSKTEEAKSPHDLAVGKGGWNILYSGGCHTS
jgi:hypothetical protein